MKRRRLRPVRLTDVPFEKRTSAARRAAVDASDDNERSAIITAALFPSDKVFWVYVDESLSAAA